LGLVTVRSHAFAYNEPASAPKLAAGAGAKPRVAHTWFALGCIERLHVDGSRCTLVVTKGRSPGLRFFGYVYDVGSASQAAALRDTVLVGIQAWRRDVIPRLKQSDRLRRLLQADRHAVSVESNHQHRHGHQRQRDANRPTDGAAGGGGDGGDREWEVAVGAAAATAVAATTQRTADDKGLEGFLQAELDGMKDEFVEIATKRCVVPATCTTPVHMHASVSALHTSRDGLCPPYTCMHRHRRSTFLVTACVGDGRPTLCGSLAATLRLQDHKASPSIWDVRGRPLPH
jgi:hypothetical protein